MKHHPPHRAVALAIVLLAMATTFVAAAGGETPPESGQEMSRRTPRSGSCDPALTRHRRCRARLPLEPPDLQAGAGVLRRRQAAGVLGSFVLSGGFQARDITTDPAGTSGSSTAKGARWSSWGTTGACCPSWAAKGRDIAIGPTGDVYLVTADEVERYSPDGNLISKWGAPGKSGGFGEAWGIDVGPDGLVYVADSWGERIDVFAADGTFVRGWKADGIPYGIAVAPTGDVYLADTGADQVQEFSPTGSLIRSWGISGGRAGRFYTPTGIAVGPEGDVYVADAAEEYPDQRTSRVQKFTPDGRFLTQWGDLPIARPRITAGPAPKTRRDSAALAFSSPKKPTYFECHLLGSQVPVALKRLRRCSSPKHYDHLRPGHKIFEVFAVVNGRDGPASRRAWTVLPRS